MRALNNASLLTACHDISDGGLAVAAAEMALAGGVGVALSVKDGLEETAWWFGEDQGRYLIAIAPEHITAVTTAVRTAGVSALTIGTAGGDVVSLGEDTLSLTSLREAYEACLPALFGES